MAYLAIAVVLTVLVRSGWGSTASFTRAHFTASVANLGQGRWWTVLTSMFVAHHLIGLIIAGVLLATVGIWCERRLGSLRYAAIGVSSHLVGTGAALLIGRALVGADWGGGLKEEFISGFLPWLLGTGAAATGLMDTLWRRRWRTGALVGLLTLAGFAGRLPDIAHLIAFALGLIVGIVAFQGVRKDRQLIGTAHEGRNLVAVTLLALIGSSGVAALRPTGAGPLAPLRLLFREVPLTWDDAASLCTADATGRPCRSAVYALFTTSWPPAVSLIAFLFLLVVFAFGLRKGWRAAWIGAVSVCAALAALAIIHISVASHDFDRYVIHGHGPDTILNEPDYQLYLGALIPLALLLLLWATRHFFTRALPRGHVRPVLLGIGLMVGLAIAVRFGSGLLLADQHEPVATPLLVLQDAPLALLPPSMATFLPPVLFPVTETAQLWRDIPTAVLWCAIAAAFGWMFWRKKPATEAVARMTQRVLNPGGSHLSWITTWPGNNHWFSGSAAVAYRVAAGVALTAADPVCAPGRLHDAVRDFSRFASESGLTPAFYTVNADTAKAARAMDFLVVKIGEETVLDLPGLAFKGKAFQDIRTAMNRAGREGITVEQYTWPTLPLRIREQLRAISEHWVSEKGLPEMGFTLGGFDQLADPRVAILVAQDSERLVHGAISLLPVYRDGELIGRTLDFMRRREDGFRPVMELLIATAAAQLRDDGLQFLSLSSSPLVSADAAPTDPSTLDTLLTSFADRLEPLYGFKSLLAFKSKFGPRYEPIYLAVPDGAALGQVVAAIGAAHFPTLSPVSLGWSLVFSD